MALNNNKTVDLKKETNLTCKKRFVLHIFSKILGNFLVFSTPKFHKKKLSENFVEINKCMYRTHLVLTQASPA